MKNERVFATGRFTTKKYRLNLTISGTLYQLGDKSETVRRLSGHKVGPYWIFRALDGGTIWVAFDHRNRVKMFDDSQRRRLDRWSARQARILKRRSKNRL